MARVTRSGGVVAACVWDHGGSARAAQRLLGGRPRDRPGCPRRVCTWPASAKVTLRSCSAAAGIRDIVEATLSVSLEHPTFEAWWEPFTGGVGPAGSFVASLEPGAPDRAARDLPRAAARGAVHPDRACLGGAGPRVAIRRQVARRRSSRPRGWSSRSTRTPAASQPAMWVASTDGKRSRSCASTRVRLSRLM